MQGLSNIFGHNLMIWLLFNGRQSNKSSGNTLFSHVNNYIDANILTEILTNI